MADTIRLLAALQALFPDNITGDISPQDLRDFLVSVMPTGRRALKVVAANNTPALLKSAADKVCNGTADEVEINDAYAEAVALGVPGSLLLLPGTFTIAAAVNVNDANVNLRGCGKNQTIITTTVQTIEGIRVKPASGVAEHMSIGGFKIDMPAISNQAALYIEDVRFFDMDHVHTSEGLYGLHAHGTIGRFFAKHCRFYNPDTGGAAVRIAAGRQAGGGTEPVAQVGFENCGIELGSNGGLIAIQLGITGGSYPLEDELDELVLVNCNVQGNGGAGEVAIDAITGLFASACIGTMFRDFDTVLDMTNFNQADVPDNAHLYLDFLACRFGINRQSLFKLRGNRTRVRLTDCDDNRTSAGTAKHLLECLSESPMLVVDGLSGANWNGKIAKVTGGTPKVFLGPLEMDVGGTIQASDAGATFRGTNDGPDAPLCSRGTATITSGNTSVVVSHGLYVTPLAQHIQVTPIENPTNDPGHLWVDTITSTQFTIHCRADPGASGLDIAWNVRML